MRPSNDDCALAGMRDSISGSRTFASRRALIAWCFYDWANSAYPTVVITFVFAAYYAKAVAVDEIAGTAGWAFAMSVGAGIVAVLAPVLSAIADRGGRRKPWLAVFTVLCVIASALLWFTRPDPSWSLWALTFAVIGNVAFEIGQSFYNAMLPDLVPSSHFGRLSGWGWSLGYAGGLGCLALAFVGFVQNDTPWFGLDKAASEHIRIVAVLVAVWFAVFSLPMFLFTPDTPSRKLPAATAVRLGLATLVETVRNLRHHGQIVRFLLAQMIYIDGMNTLFAFGGIYAAGTFGMDFSEIILFGIAINVTAGFGAFAFAWVDDWIGPKRTILIALFFLALFGGLLLVVEGKVLFWAFALPLGIFIGPAQAASRSLMARMAPPGMINEMFGLYSLSGKATAFTGPLMLGWATVAFDSQRAGMSTIIVLFILGFLLLAFTVRDPTRDRPVERHPD